MNSRGDQRNPPADAGGSDLASFAGFPWRALRLTRFFNAEIAKFGTQKTRREEDSARVRKRQFCEYPERVFGLCPSICGKVLLFRRASPKHPRARFGRRMLSEAQPPPGYNCAWPAKQSIAANRAAEPRGTAIAGRRECECAGRRVWEVSVPSKHSCGLVQQRVCGFRI